jgi:Tol biopolymer transport system component
MTGQGTIQGTFQYMAPEQLEGARADARTDVFALGTVLYEMVTGRRAFEGKSRVSLIAAILEREPPPVSAQQAASPPALDSVIKRCLAKDPDERWQSAGDLAAALRFLQAPGAGVLTAANREGPPSAAARRTLLRTALAAVLAAAAAVAAVETYRLWNEPQPEVMRFEVAAPANAVFGTLLATEANGAISPDGRMLAFTALEDGTSLLWVRPLDGIGARSYPGTENSGLPFWSPDSRWIAFFADGKLKRVPAAGGTPQSLADAPLGHGGTWGSDGTIVFSPGAAGGLRRVSANGGESASLTMLSRGESSHRFPSFLPDGRRFLYFVVGPAEVAGVHVGALDTGNSAQRLTAADSAAIYSPSGHLMFVSQGTLFAQPFDPSTLKFGGDPTRIAESIPLDGSAASQFSVSDSGVLTYRAGLGYSDQQFGWFDRSGELLETVGAPGAYRGVDLSPDGTRVAVHRHDGDGGDTWIIETRGTTTRFTFDASQENSTPIWSRDGTRIFFGSRRNGLWGIYRKASDGSGTEELLIESEVLKTPMDSTPDGGSIIYWTATTPNLWVLPLDGERQPRPLLESSFGVGHPQISPNGRWVVFQSDESGQREVYVRPFPSGIGLWQVSTNGGTYARWRADGKEVYYLSATSRGDLMAVAVDDSGSALALGAPQRLFPSGYMNVGHAGGAWHTYAVSGDGQRFLIPRPVAALEGEAPSTPISVVLNWTRLLGRDRP